MSAHRDIATWLESRDLECLERPGGWAVTLPDARDLALDIGRDKVAFSVSLTAEMRSWPLDRLLRWSCDSPLGVSCSYTGEITVRAAVPLSGLEAGHLSGLLESAIRMPERSHSEIADGDLSIIRRVWEGQISGALVWDTDFGIAASCTSGGVSVEMSAKPSVSGTAVESLALLGTFIEPECAPALHRYLATTNARIAFGAHALDSDGSVIFRMIVPVPAGHVTAMCATQAAIACAGVFSTPIRCIAAEPAVAEWWERFNVVSVGPGTEGQAG